MKILIYGGCHATALKRILDKYSLSELSVDTLINFRMIATKAAFPYADLKNYDLVLFNPILNRGEYNSTHIEDHCKLHGIRFFKYPWLQWGGYWPEPKKRNWGNSSEWGLFFLKKHMARYSSLPDGKSQESDFESYYESLFEGSSFDSIMDSEIEKTTKQLVQRELDGGADFKISKYIIENFDKKQLFLTPDHPSTELYKYIVKVISEAIHIRIDPSFYSSNIEIQEGIRTPILPGVSVALSLNFSGADWCNNEFLGDSSYSLRDFAKTTFPGTPVFLASAKNNTRLKMIDSTNTTAIGPKKKLLVSLDKKDAPKDHVKAHIFGPSPYSRTSAFLYKPHWIFSSPDF
jgi:hypothetical protein